VRGAVTTEKFGGRLNDRALEYVAAMERGGKLIEEIVGAGNIRNS
jgi:hypothetical protein